MLNTTTWWGVLAKCLRTVSWFGSRNNDAETPTLVSDTFQFPQKLSLHRNGGSAQDKQRDCASWCIREKIAICRVLADRNRVR